MNFITKDHLIKRVTRVVASVIPIFAGAKNPADALVLTAAVMGCVLCCEFVLMIVRPHLSRPLRALTAMGIIVTVLQALTWAGEVFWIQKMESLAFIWPMVSISAFLLVYPATIGGNTFVNRLRSWIYFSGLVLGVGLVRGTCGGLEVFWPVSYAVLALVTGLYLMLRERRIG